MGPRTRSNARARTRAYAGAALFALALILGGAPAWAQTPAAAADSSATAASTPAAAAVSTPAAGATSSGPSADATAPAGADAQSPTPTPVNSPNWAGMVMLGYTQQTWQTNQRTLTSNGELTGKTWGGTTRIEVVVLRASVEVPGLPERVVVADNEAMQGIYSRTLSGMWIVADMARVQHNGQVGLHSRIDDLAGAGIDAKTKRLELEVIPGIGAAYTDLQGVAGATGTTAECGLFELLNFKMNSVWTFTNWLYVQRDLSLGNNTGVFAYAGLTGMVTKHLGLGPNYSYNYQDLVQPGTIKDLGTLTISAQYRF